MAIITKPGSITKGTPATFTLNKSQLLSSAPVQADSYFNDSSNWSRVSVVYKSNPGKQYEIVEFDPSQATPTGLFSISEKARDVFQVQSVQIFDFDGGVLDIYRSQLTTADFDIDLTPAPPVNNNITWNFAGNANYSLNGQNQVTSSYVTLSGSESNILYSSNSYAIGDGLEYKIKVDNGFFPSSTQFQFIGLKMENTGSYSGLYRDGSPNQVGINNTLGNFYTYPVSSEIEFKIIIKTTETLFYANNILIFSASGISGNSLTRIIPCLRLNNQYNVKEYSIVSLI